MRSKAHTAMVAMFSSASEAHRPSSPARRTSQPAVFSASARMPKSAPALWRTWARAQLTRWLRGSNDA